MRFTVLIPTYNHGAIIEQAIKSVLQQSHADWELFVVADGAPEVTHETVCRYAQQDNRIRLYKFSKGERNGEAWRAKALEDATGEAVAYLGDDDFWAPDHLETLEPFLKEADFAHTRQTEFLPDYTVYGQVGSLTDLSQRTKMCTERFNFFGPSVVGHRLDSYRKLPSGWSPAPPDVWSDLHMWRKWFSQPGLKFVSSPAVTLVRLPSPQRRHWTSEERFVESSVMFDLFHNHYVWGALRAKLPENTDRIHLTDILQAALKPDRKQIVRIAAAKKTKKRFNTIFSVLQKRTALAPR